MNNHLRRIPLSDTLNLRDLGGYAAANCGATRWNAFFRSACPNSLSSGDGEILRGLCVTDVIDLRGGDNADEVMRGYEVLPFLNVHHIPVGDEAAPKTASEVPSNYLKIAEHCNMPQVFRVLAESRGGVIFHCFAGKDRTGVVAAILLMLADVSDEDIIADYTLTYAYFIKRLREDFLRDDAEPNVFKPLPDHMEGFMRLFREKYCDVRSFLLKQGVTEQQINKILRKFVVFPKG